VCVSGVLMQLRQSVLAPFVVVVRSRARVLLALSRALGPFQRALLNDAQTSIEPTRVGGLANRIRGEKVGPPEMLVTRATPAAARDFAQCRRPRAHRTWRHARGRDRRPRPPVPRRPVVARPHPPARPAGACWREPLPTARSAQERSPCDQARAKRPSRSPAPAGLRLHEHPSGAPARPALRLPKQLPRASPRPQDSRRPARPTAAGTRIASMLSTNRTGGFGTPAATPAWRPQIAAPTRLPAPGRPGAPPSRQHRNRHHRRPGRRRDRRRE